MIAWFWVWGQKTITFILKKGRWPLQQFQRNNVKRPKEILSAGFTEKSVPSLIKSDQVQEKLYFGDIERTETANTSLQNWNRTSYQDIFEISFGINHLYIYLKMKIQCQNNLRNKRRREKLSFKKYSVSRGDGGSGISKYCFLKFLRPFFVL